MSAKRRGMKLHRFLAFLALLALVIAPFGRMAAAEAMAPAHQAGMAMSGHCDDMPAPEGDGADRMLDCMNACAALAAVADAEMPDRPAAAAILESRPPADAAGLNPEAEPPPPRLS